MHAAPSVTDMVGIVGVVLTLWAYYLLNINKLQSTDLSYLWMNLIGSSLVLYSLTYDWNLSSVLIESAWVLISMIGLYRVMKKQKIK